MIYSDFKKNLDIHPVKKDLTLSKSAEAIKQSIINLMLTGPYERRFRPTIGSGLQKYLFELVTPQTAIKIRSSIINTINTFEPRCELLDVIVKIDTDYNSYSATIKFRTSTETTPVVFTQILERIR